MALIFAALLALGSGCLTTSPSPRSSRGTLTVGAPPTRTAPVDPLAGAPEPFKVYAATARALGDALRAAGASCDAVATALDGWTQRHATTFRDALAAVDRWEVDADRVAARDYHAIVWPDIEARVDAGERCDDHAGARAAFERFYRATGFDNTR